MMESLPPEPHASTGSVTVNEPPTPAIQSPEELITKGIAPVKRDYLCPPPARSSSVAVEKETSEANSQPNKLVQEKKSKRQLKRERLEERKSKLNLCPAVAKSGDASSCPHGSNCRFSHDLESYHAQKPDDLEGICPFSASEKTCPYGLACRFSGSHVNSSAGENGDERKVGTEVNGLQKDVQRLLWKNRMKFPKADDSLKLLGIAAKDYSKPKGGDDKVEECHPNESAESNGLEGNGHNGGASDESRPLKKPKSLNGVSISEEDPGKLSKDKPQGRLDDLIPETDVSLKLHPREKKLIDFSRKLYLAPLTTVGNLPFRRLCKALGADVTCGEMALCTNLLQGQASEWALLRRHSSEDLFGVQICGAYPDTVARTVELIDRECSVDFIDINMGCPIDIVVDKGAGSALITKPLRMKNVIQAASAVASTPITVKVRTGYIEGRNRVDKFIEDIADWGASALTIHGRSRQQRYSKPADWEYITQCVEKAPDSLQVLGNGDVCSYLDWNKHFSDCPKLSSSMIARGALVKPWIFTEIKEQRLWDISSGERLDILKDYVRFGLHHWGSDTKGVETTRHFLLQWLSYACRYIPVGLLDVVPPQLNWRPPSYFGRNDLETLMASESAADWIRISEMLLGKVPEGFTFTPKHKSNAYNSAENG